MDPAPKEATDGGTQQERSLLEDASTLLMFHNTAVTKQESKPASPALLPNVTVNKSPSPLSTSTTTTTTPGTASSSSAANRQTGLTGLSSPGPAIAALAENSDSTDSSERNQKGIVAAAALAAAAGIPLPLIRNQPMSVDETLRQPSKEDQEIHSDASTADLNMKDDNDDANARKNDNQEGEEEEETQDEKPELSKPQQQKKRTKKTKPQSNSPVNPYRVDANAGIITCICGFEHDDGFTIQCDKCNRWQHALCMGVEHLEDVPDIFSCNVCEPRKLDVKKAKQLQLKHLEEMKNKDKKSDGEEDDGANGATGGENTENKSKEDKPPSTTKPRQKLTPYGKNLEESDINVLDAKVAHNVVYYQLDKYDYQDAQVYDYITSSLPQQSDPHFVQMEESVFDSLKFPPLAVKPYTEVNSKKFNGIIKLGLFSDNTIHEDDIVDEYLGEVGFKENYIADSRNQYRIWGVEKPYVSFVPNTNLVIDARLSGNVTRFIRRSCNPNCELKVVRLSDGDIKFCVVALKTIKPGTELTLQWNWDQQHPIHNIIDGNTFDSTSDTDKPCLVLSVESILTFVECACSQTNECSLSKVKKASAHIYRSTRKGNSSSGLKLAQKEAPYSSIQERLAQRGMSNLRDSDQSVKRLIPLLQTPTITQEIEIDDRPYIYSYKKRTYKDVEDEEEDNTFPTPFGLLPEEVVAKVEAPVAAKPVKKLSFADYKRKKKPN